MTWREIYNIQKNPSMNYIFLRNSEKTALNSGGRHSVPLEHTFGTGHNSTQIASPAGWVTASANSSEKTRLMYNYCFCTLSIVLFFI
jgi:hypothetical protein